MVHDVVDCGKMMIARGGFHLFTPTTFGVGYDRPTNHRCSKEWKLPESRRSERRSFLTAQFW